MKEALVILAVIAVLLGLTAVRYRRQIAGMLQVWRMLRSMRQQIKDGARNAAPPEPIAEGPLVSCSRCRAWVPQDRAIKLGRSTFYCSSACVEKAAEAA